ncbi:MAG TPA: hypothetical protein PL089_15395 [Ignavibacteria bacterium]|nr:hypothetical protein [Ignavibacteria bacterium]
MKTLEFTYNWNNKLDCKCFTSIRLSDRYRVGEEFKIILINKKVPQVKGVARIIEIKEFYLHQLNTFIAALDTGYSVPECKKIIERMYKNTDFENKQLKLILFLKIDSKMEYKISNSK